MAKPHRPSLEVMEKTNPASLVSDKGVVYCNTYVLGEGSFGKVYLGWIKDKGKKVTTEVAVKVIDRISLKKEKKLKENLEREIYILKLMKECDYIVKIMDARELRKTILITMELCDYDLDSLVKNSPLQQDEVVTFLYHLGEGMKALRKHNIVHRDLKPSNILIKELSDTGKRMFKLADFGFARRFKDDADRDIRMMSLAGTPVYMAPEALDCLFDRKKHYDDKVDVWSIGALLYTVIVGECGFYAHLDKILELLKLKGDNAIAFKNTKDGRVAYVEELPTSVKLKEPFRLRMNKLLRHMLKFDPQERMPFHSFFDTVDDLITSKIEVISLLHGTSFKIVSDQTVRAQTLVNKVCNNWQVSPDSLIIFSPASPHSISSRKLITDAEFDDLLRKSGGTHGHAKLYVLVINQGEDLVADLSSFDPLKFAIENNDVVQLVTRQKFCDDIVYMIQCMGAQLKTQLEGLEKLEQFTMKEIGLSQDYARLMEDIHQTLATVTLAVKWLERDMGVFGAECGQCGEYLRQLKERKMELQQLAVKLRSRSAPTLSAPRNSKEYNEKLTELTDLAKKLPRVLAENIPAKSKELYERCTGVIQRATDYTKQQIFPFVQALASLRDLYERSAQVSEMKGLVEQAEAERERVMRAHIKNTPTPLSEEAVTTPSVPTANHTPYDAGTEVLKLTEEVEQLNQRLTAEQANSQQIQRRLDEALTREGVQQLRVNTEGGEVPLEEMTIVSPPVGGEERAALADTGREPAGPEMTGLVKILSQFCTEAQRISLPIPGANLFTDLTESGNELEDYSTGQLLSMAQRLADTLETNMPSLRKLAAIRDADEGLRFRIGYPAGYREGDVVIFVPFKTARGHSVPMILHLLVPKPVMFLDVRSYEVLNLRPKKLPPMFFAQLSETPRCMRLENHGLAAKDLREQTGEFYRVQAVPINLELLDNCPLLLRSQK